MFVLDSSNSIVPEDFNKVKKLVYNYTSELHSVREDNRVGIILYGNTAKVYLALEDGDLTMGNKNATLQKIREIPHLQQFTNTADGLCKMSNQTWRNDADVFHVAIVLTDGKSNYHSKDCGGNTEQVATFIHDHYSRITVLAIGVGDKIYERELSLIVSENYLVSRLDNFDQLVGMEDALKYQICFSGWCGCTAWL